MKNTKFNNEGRNTEMKKSTKKETAKKDVSVASKIMNNKSRADQIKALNDAAAKIEKGETIEEKIETAPETVAVKVETAKITPEKVESLYRTSLLNRNVINKSRDHIMDDMIQNAITGITANDLTACGRKLSAVRSHLNTLQRMGKVVRVQHLYFSTENYAKLQK